MNDERTAFLKKRIALYQKDPNLFFKEVTMFKPDDWQRRVASDIGTSPKVSVRSGHGVGKTALQANIILWFLSCFPFARVVATAPTMQQLNDILWAEVEKWRSRSPLLKDLLVWTKTYVYVKGYEKRWFAVAKTASAPENMQGFHADNMLIVVDEASGVEDEIMEAILATLSGDNNKLLMCANPTRTSGTFYDSHNRDRGMYKCHRVSSMDSSRTNKENIAAFIRKYGEESNVVKVRVFGDFPTQEDDAFIPLPLIERSVGLVLESEKIQRISMGVDVARYGDDETIIATNIGGKIDLPVIRHGQNLMHTVGDIVQQYRKLIAEYPAYTGVIAINIDDTGLGGGVTDRLEEVKREQRFRRMEIVPVNFAMSPPKDGSESHYGDISTYMWAGVRTMMENREISLVNDEELVAQLSVRKYFVMSNGKMVLESKADMKKRSIKSPDRADAIALSCFTQNKIYSTFNDQNETVIIPHDAVRSMPIRQINIGISIGNAITGAAMVATGIASEYKKVIVLASIKIEGEVDTESLGQIFKNFCLEIRQKYGRLDYAYCETKEVFLYRCIKKSADVNGIPINVRQAANDEVNNRIRLTTRLMQQNRLFLTDQCDSLATAFSAAVWDDRGTKDSRSESAYSNLLNAFEYTIEREAARFLSNEKRG